MECSKENLKMGAVSEAKMKMASWSQTKPCFLSRKYSKLPRATNPIWTPTISKPFSKLSWKIMIPKLTILLKSRITIRSNTRQSKIPTLAQWMSLSKCFQIQKRRAPKNSHMWLISRKVLGVASKTSSSTFSRWARAASRRPRPKRKARTKKKHETLDSVSSD